MKIYVVLGVSGRYDDHETWIARAFADSDKATRYMEIAKRKAKEIAAARMIKPSEEIENPVDPNFIFNAYVNYYEIQEVELEGVTHIAFSFTEGARSK